MMSFSADHFHYSSYAPDGKEISLEGVFALLHPMRNLVQDTWWEVQAQLLLLACHLLLYLSTSTCCFGSSNAFSVVVEMVMVKIKKKAQLLVTHGYDFGHRSHCNILVPNR